MPSRGVHDFLIYPVEETTTRLINLITSEVNFSLGDIIFVHTTKKKKKMKWKKKKHK